MEDVSSYKVGCSKGSDLETSVFACLYQKEEEIGGPEVTTFPELARVEKEREGTSTAKAGFMSRPSTAFSMDKRLIETLEALGLSVLTNDESEVEEAFEVTPTSIPDTSDHTEDTTSLSSAISTPEVTIRETRSTDFIPPTQAGLMSSSSPSTAFPIFPMDKLIKTLAEEGVLTKGESEVDEVAFEVTPTSVPDALAHAEDTTGLSSTISTMEETFRDEERPARLIPTTPNGQTESSSPGDYVSPSSVLTTTSQTSKAASSRFLKLSLFNFFTSNATFFQISLYHIIGNDLFHDEPRRHFDLRRIPPGLGQRRTSPESQAMVIKQVWKYKRTKIGLFPGFST